MQNTLQFPASAQQIATHLDRRLDAVQKSIERQKLQPERRFGIVRAFGQSAFEAIRDDLQRIEEMHTRRQQEREARAHGRQMAGASY